MKNKLLLLSLAVLLVSSLMPSVNSSTTTTDTKAVQPDQQEEEIPITGLKRPTIDGVIGPSDLNGPYLGEWEDAQSRAIDLLSSSGAKVSAQMRLKSVGDEILVGLLLPADIDPTGIAIIALQVDRDNDNTLSTGDIKMVLHRYGQEIKGIQLDDMTQKLEFSVYDSGNWKLIDAMAEGGMPLTFSWGSMAIGQQANANLPTQIELSIDLFRIEQDLSNYPSKRHFQQNVVNGDYEQFRYGLIIQGLGDLDLGYPVAPDEEEGIQVYDVATYDVPPIIPGTDVWVEDIFVMQATHRSDWRGTIVQGKDTLVRVLLGTDAGVPVSVHVVLHLYQSYFISTRYIGFYEQNFTIPLNPRIQRGGDTVNFFIPAPYTNFTQMLFRAEVTSYEDTWDPNPANNRLDKAQLFDDNRPMNIFVIPINTAADGDPPSLPSTDGINTLKTYTRHMLPTPVVNFFDLPWEMLGHMPREDSDYIKSRLDDLYLTLIANRRASMRAGLPYMRFPHQLVGVRATGFGGTGGSSTPSWGLWGGNARVSWIALTNGGGGAGMLHELNHNLGPSSWGHHVTGVGYGCGAPDGVFSNDGDWDSLYGDNIIHTQGWAPWIGIISAFTPELMTYCQSGYNPTAWISSYRWELLYTRLQSLQIDTPVRVTSPLHLDAEAQDSTYRSISGIIHDDGTALLLPAIEVPGIAGSSPYIAEPDAYVRVFYLNGTTTDLPIRVNFRDIENNTMDSMYFTRTIPDNGQITAITLNNATDDKTWDSKKPTGAQVYATLSYPQSVKPGEEFEVNWYPQADNKTNLYSQLLYSPDGNGYYPLGIPTTAGSMMLTLNNLPGGDSSHFRVLISDGFQTTVVDGPVISVAQHEPKVEILEGRDLILDTGGVLTDHVIHGTVGGPIGVSVASQGQYGLLLPALQYQLVDLKTNAVVKSVTGPTTPVLRVSKPGEYQLKVSGTDPRTGLSNSDSIKVLVTAPIPSALKSDLQSFYDKLGVLRAAYGEPTESSTSTTQNQQTSDTDTGAAVPQFTNPLPVQPIYGLIALVLYSFSRKYKLHT